MDDYIQKIADVQDMTDVQNIEDVQHMTDVQEIADVQDMTDVQNIEDVQEIADVQENTYVKNIENLPEIEFIFYHIEKCGGCSLRNTLYSYFINIFEKNKIYDSNNVSNNCVLEFNKQNIEIIKKNTDYNNLKVILSHIRLYEFPFLFINTPFKITILRNPIDRIISHYYFFDKNKYNCEFIDLPKIIFKKYCRGHGHHICRVLNCIEKKNGFNENKIMNIIKNFTFILILENIDEDIQFLNKILNKHYNINYIMQMTHINKSNKTYIKDLNLLKEKIKKYCIPDYKVYNMVKEYNKTNYQ
jgi:hypothetical protein